MTQLLVSAGVDTIHKLDVTHSLHFTNPNDYYILLYVKILNFQDANVLYRCSIALLVGCGLETLH